MAVPDNDKKKKKTIKICIAVTVRAHHSELV